MKSIAIIGGGPGGLTLARILANKRIQATVYELDEHALARPQGGSLDLHETSGLRALEEAGLLDGFRALARYDDQGDAIYDIQGNLRFEHRGGTEYGMDARPEIDRTQLRDLLLQSLPASAIRWGTKLRAVEPLPGDRFRLLGDNGVIDEVDRVIGADGAWSKVRPLVSPAQPRYTGITFLELWLEEVDARHPEIARLVPSGKISAAGNSQGLIAQRSSGGQLRAYYMFRVPEDWLATGGLDLSSMESARASLKRALPGWSPKLLSFIDAASRIIPRPLISLPIGHRWPHRHGVTLLGDAAHLMPPFSGEGVNLAMLDACELANALAAPGDTEQSIAAYEEAMFARAEAASRDAHEGMDFVSEQGLEHVLAHFEEMKKQLEATPR